MKAVIWSGKFLATFMFGSMLLASVHYIILAGDVGSFVRFMMLGKEYQCEFTPEQYKVEVTRKDYEKSLEERAKARGVSP